MIKLDIQLFAKSASQMRQYRKTKLISKYAREAKEQPKSKDQDKKTESDNKRTKGEAVTAVSTREVYELYRIENGKETPVIRDGAIVTRTGAEILNKMTFNKTRGVWVSKAKGLKYRVRKRN